VQAPLESFISVGNPVNVGSSLTIERVGRDVHTGDEVAIKLEHCDVGLSLLDQEIDMYKSLQGRTGFPGMAFRASIE
jgi:hypothetical protein